MVRRAMPREANDYRRCIRRCQREAGREGGRRGRREGCFSELDCRPALVATPAQAMEAFQQCATEAMTEDLVSLQCECLRGAGLE